MINKLFENLRKTLWMLAFRKVRDFSASVSIKRCLAHPWYLWKMKIKVIYLEYWVGFYRYTLYEIMLVDCVWNVMAHAQKPNFVFRRNGRVHLNRRGRQFSRLLAAEVCGSAVVMLDTSCSEVVWRVLATHSIRQFPLHFPSRTSPCAITFQLDYTKCLRGSNPGGGRYSVRPDRTWDPPILLYQGYRVFTGGKLRPGRAADHSPPSSAMVVEE